jgi:hypothetical protein
MQEKNRKNREDPLAELSCCVENSESKKKIVAEN